jgi:hypothetical protein
MKEKFFLLAALLSCFLTTAISGKTVDYMEIQVAVVHYGLSETDLLAIQKGLEIARTFFWRNSGFQLHLHLVYIPITTLLPWTEDSRWDENIEKAITDAGYELSDFGAIFHISTDVDGTWSWGVHGNFDLGFSHSVFPVPTGVVYPVDDPSVDIGIIWIFTHEFQHALDEMYRRAGYPEMFHGDQPLVYAEKAGEHFSYQAEGLRRFIHYLGLDAYTNKWGKTWGTRKSFVDNDENGIPDDAPELPCDDRRLGPGWTREKYMAGIYQGDLRGYVYVLPSGIKQYTPRIDGTIEGSWTLLSDKLMYDAIGTTTKVYAAWDHAFLYLAGSADKAALLRIWIDLEGDGWWHGRANYEIVFNILDNFVEVAHSMDCSPETRTYDCALGGGPRDDGLCGELWDDDPRYPWGRILRPSDITSAVNRGDDGVYRFELAIPAALREGQEVGYRIVFESQGRRATVFEDYQFVHLPLLPMEPLEVLFHENFEHPTAWTRTGLWHICEETCNWCSNTPLQGNYAHYAIYGQCSYDEGRRTLGYLTSPVITVPANTEFVLMFDFARFVESNRRAARDRTYVQIRLGREVRGSIRWTAWRTVWSQSSKDHSPECGTTPPILIRTGRNTTLQIRFVFDSVNRLHNNYPGWAIDNVRILPRELVPAGIPLAEEYVDEVESLDEEPLFVLTVSPNPVTGRMVVFSVDGVEAEALQVEVYDLGGRLVYKAETFGGQLTWDTLDATGKPVANGVYLVLAKVKVDGEWLSADLQKILILR